jgi:hypothetical protein
MEGSAQSSQDGPAKLTFANHPKNGTPYNPESFQHKPPGPQLWAIFLSIAGIYLLWTRILGRPLPSFLSSLRSKNGQRAGKGHSAAEMAAAREKQQQRLQTANRAREMVSQAKERNVRERANATINSGNSTIQQQLEANRQQQLDKQRQHEREETKRKQRQLYLRKKAELEKAEEEKKKDEELGPGWRYRQDPTIGAGAIDGMNPQSGGEGGYKPQTCTRRGG